mmetsp:Transcript_10509/g.12370  ORF Transcript_10509/g.12370 Transcript_10509/m.12370 type:complete len:375 (+) Transcript_10509:43-1167(+)
MIHDHQLIERKQSTSILLPPRQLRLLYLLIAVCVVTFMSTARNIQNLNYLSSIADGGYHNTSTKIDDTRRYDDDADQPTTNKTKRTTTTHKQQHYDRTTIRRWGCAARNETPFIFVHIGKAGGGEVRRMFAAAARNYTNRGPDVENFAQKTVYYSITPNYPNSTTAVKARFFSSRHRQIRPSHEFERGSSFERNECCDAETPIGQASLCPARVSKCPAVAVPAAAASCHLVYVGHNMLGNELHWLPNRYLERWWDSAFVDKETNTIPSWGDIPKGSRYTRKEWKDMKSHCHTKRSIGVDSMARQVVSSLYLEDTTEGKAGENTVSSWAPIYASLHVLRVTMIREPFSWLASKYGWHKLQKNKMSRTMLIHDGIE